MKLAFIDLGDWDYDADTPYASPLGGSQSAAVYLAAELALAGLDVAYVNNVAAARRSRGIDFIPRGAVTGEHLARFDVLIVIGSGNGQALRATLGLRGPMVLWTQHAYDQPAVRNLASAAERAAWTAFVAVSEWHRDGLERHLGVERARMTIMRNAASPAFLARPARAPWFERGADPVLAYTSTPFRGLDVLLAAFPAIREQVPGTRLKVFSSLQVYQVAAGADAYAHLYQLCRSLPGAEYVGSLPQSDLARELDGIAALAYPSTFAETSCISVMEAMAAGAMILTTSLGALPETGHGYARLIAPDADLPRLARGYAAMVVQALREARAAPAETAAHLARQARFARETYDWKRRAREWLEWLPSLRC